MVRMCKALSFFLVGSLLFSQAPRLQERTGDSASLARWVGDRSPALQADFVRALDLARDNRKELEAAVAGCRTPREELAMTWLIAQMPAWNFAIKNEKGWELKQDLETLPAKLLIDNLQYALAARDRFPWGRNLPWDRFLGFVLPYRGTQEPAQEWRPALWAELVPRVSGQGNAAKAVQIVNKWAAGKFKYLLDDAEQDLGVLEAIQRGTGRCEDLTNFATAAVRTIGIPCTAAYTPWWPLRDGNHTWNEAWIDGRWRSFMGCEPEAKGRLLDRIKENSVFAKVYRKNSPGLPGEAEPFGEDVTRDYSPVADLVLETGAPARQVQLGVWSQGGWRPVAVTSTTVDGKALFRNVGCRKPYLITAFFSDASLQLAAPPVLFGPRGNVEKLDTRELLPGHEALQQVTLKALEPNTTYGLVFFSDQQWQLVTKATARPDGRVDFGRAGRPNTLYVLSRSNGRSLQPEGRPFLVEIAKGRTKIRTY